MIIEMTKLMGGPELWGNQISAGIPNCSVEYGLCFQKSAKPTICACFFNTV